MNIEYRTLSDPLENRGLLFVVSAPSGAGKTSLCRELIDRFDNLRHSVSFTTRKIRAGEVEGVDYHFVDQSTFTDMIEQNHLAEWAEVHGNHYGTSLQTLEQAAREGVDLLLDIDCQGAAQLKKNYPGGIFVFILPPSFSELERRLRGRETDTEEVIDRRLKNSQQEIAEASKYDYQVVNDKFDVALKQLCAIIVAEHCRTERIQSDMKIT
ncbi:MAG TPA: guanylate kinase [Geopsychrobacteraceae bacterium]|nr:guanylate kinase [Geopsychrobacteraceae bacterium]